MRVVADTYISPWKGALEHALPEFLQFYFPHVYLDIDWSQEYVFLDEELQAAVKDEELRRPRVERLVRVSAHSGLEQWLMIHIEFQASRDRAFSERVFGYNHRLYDCHGRPVASLALLADNLKQWKPAPFEFDLFGCRSRLDFPIAKLLDHAGNEERLLPLENPFALLTAAHLLARSARNNDRARFAIKWRLIRQLYVRNWNRQRVIDLFLVIDWLIQLPEELQMTLWQNIETLEKKNGKPYISSIERLGMKKGFDQGHTTGKADALLLLLEKRYGEVTEELRKVVNSANGSLLDHWLGRQQEATSLKGIFPHLHSTAKAAKARNSAASRRTAWFQKRIPS